MNPAEVNANGSVVGPSRTSLGLAKLRGYAFAVLSVAASIAALLLFEHLGLRLPTAVFMLLPIAIHSWYGERGPALVSFVVALLGMDYFFLQPRHQFAVRESELPYFIAFTSFAVLVLWFSTVRRRIEADLRRTRAEIEALNRKLSKQVRLFDQTHDSILFRDLNDSISYWNRGAHELYGWTAEEAIGKVSRDLLKTVFPAPIKDIDAELLRAGVWEGELRNTRSDGTEVVIASRWSLAHDEDGQTTVMETNNDLTERKRREDEVRQLNQELANRAAQLDASNKELEAFAYSVSHDLRAPLRHMAGFAELLQKTAAASLNEKSERYLKNILEAAGRMGRLIDDLLAFSRIGRAEAHRTMVDLNQIVREVVAEARQDAKARSILWKIDPLPVCDGDYPMLRLAFVNLIGNAVKFTRTRAQGEIEIGCKNQDVADPVLFVRDNGVGFDMKYANKLFGVFQRLHGQDDFEGTGIGLATVQRILHRHGSRIWAESTVDGGATFYFSLPKITRS
jgi:PAS domain S-box-containing protein